MKIEKHEDAAGYELNIKRCYLPYTLTSCCPKCKVENRLDMSDQYLSYPKLEEPNKAYFMCKECDHEWQEDLLISIVVVPPPVQPSDVIGHQVYLDREQCQMMGIEYIPADTKLTIGAGGLLRSKVSGYDEETTDLLKGFGERPLELQGTGIGWFTIKGVR